MGQRSLIASANGRQQAERALTRHKLTRRALADERQVASRSTVNNFFNGKPVDRLLFLEICHVLDLDWETIAQAEPDELAPPSAPPRSSVTEPAIATLLTQVQRQADAARAALMPRILHPLPRDGVMQTYLPAIDRGVSQGLARVIPIIAPAGFGKSTVLGQIYDGLPPTGWVGLILCSSLPLGESVLLSDLDQAMGLAMTGEMRSLLDAAQHLNQTQGRGVILIDTLDLILNRTVVIVFGHLVRSLLDQGTTVVFTCRDHDYSDFLEPSRDRLPLLAACLDRHTLPCFNAAEIRQVATAFFQTQPGLSTAQGEHFADTLLTLSADSRSLQVIIENPLLLALLCELFAHEENVPPDLTVSKLYQRYWHEKIAYSRRDYRHTSPIALAKDQICLTLAQTLFHRSTATLCESVYRDDLALDWTDAQLMAYEDLLSDGVLARLPSLKLHFFHQTLLEYAIAYGLTRVAAEADRQGWLDRIGQADASRTVSYWYPILRQYLTILESDREFEAAIAHLNLDNLAVFGTVALAATSRDRPDALTALLPKALALGDPFQQRLRQALELAPRQFTESVWGVMLDLLTQSQHTPAVNTAKMVGLLLSRWWSALAQRLPEALDAIAQRQTDTNQRVAHRQDDRTLLFGWILQACLPQLEQDPQPELLLALMPYFPFYGHKTCVTLIRIFQTAAIAESVRCDFLRQALAHPLPNYQPLEAAWTDFVAERLRVALGTEIGMERSLHWSSGSDALYAVHAQGWAQVQARAVGRYWATDPEQLQRVLTAIVEHQVDRIRSHSVLLLEAIAHGGDHAIAEALQLVDLSTLTPAALKTLCRLVQQLAPLFSPRDQAAIAQWVSSALSDQALLILPILDALADTSEVARQWIVDSLPTVPAQKQAFYRSRLLRFVPIDQHPALAEMDKLGQQTVVQLYREQRETHAHALPRLLDACRSRFKDVAIAASHDLEQCTPEQVSIPALIELLSSRFIGVRSNVVSAIAAQTDQGRSLSALHLDAIAHTLTQETDQTVCRLFGHIVARWVQAHRCCSPSVAQWVVTIPQRLQPKGTFDGGVGKVLIAALKAIAQSEDPRLDIPAIITCVRSFLTTLHIIKIPHSETETLDLLSAVERLQPGFLSSLITQEAPLLAQKHWHRNLSAIIKTIRRVETAQSPLLNDILSRDWCTADIEAIVLAAKGI